MKCEERTTINQVKSVVQIKVNEKKTFFLEFYYIIILDY